MKAGYILRYVAHDLWHAGNRTFTLINLVAIGIAMSVLVILMGGFLAFRKNGRQAMDKMGVGIEVSPREERELNLEEKNSLRALPGVMVYTWTPSIFLFYNRQGRLYDGLGGRTVDLADPLMTSLQDVRGDKPLSFLSKKELQTPYDELGLIIPFVMLKQLSYLPHSAIAEQPETWQYTPFPEKLKIRVKEDRSDALATVVELPIVGVVSELEGGRYLITKDCYQIFGSGWRDSFRPFLLDRHGRSLFPEAKGHASQNPLISERKLPPETHATVYAQSRDHILPLLQEIRGKLWLRADCALEYYLQEYKQQETFFGAAAGSICLVMFFFSGVVLFATFQAFILRKMKEIGILKACGASKTLVYCIFALEVIFISSMAIALGMGIGIGSGLQIGEYILTALQLPKVAVFIFPPLYMGAVFAIVLSFCLVITFFPVRMAIKIDPDQVIRM
jgi:hypothetical protein